MKIQTYFSAPLVTLISALLFSTLVLADEDQINHFSIQEKIGFKETPVVNIEVSVSKKRDLHVAVVNTEGWKTVKKATKPIKQSGKFHFELPIADLQPGNYRVDAYLTPRRKDWNDRISEPVRQNMTVINEPQFKVVKKLTFAKQDKIKKVEFPKQVVGSQAVDLLINYEVTEARDLHIKLLDSGNWKEFGALKFPVAENGQITIPLTDMTTDFPASKYAWVIFLTERSKSEPISKKQGKHFLLIND
ncbi:hypothetical protein RS130_22620 [Paraglaciecola aquimarina]|uniref:DUF4198 domain-containing protein n=1 Tax=Paraglaciecola aquimarina TaxID=1235557 RepID=A0ABU3T276_9ALTE|nr:hypothetical protein [Paraglaciecola aquimarina]MDU0356307.1 hypothetical protein [Paraglaciecola aquimarina]